MVVNAGIVLLLVGEWHAGGYRLRLVLACGWFQAQAVRVGPLERNRQGRTVRAESPG